MVLPSDPTNWEAGSPASQPFKGTDMFFVIWYEGWSERVVARETEADAKAFIDETGMDPDEFEIMEGDYPDL
jgi:hypothetical protein